jgi:hypothetical protein
MSWRLKAQAAESAMGRVVLADPAEVLASAHMRPISKSGKTSYGFLGALSLVW